mgnify:CR=1 FL=1
MSQVNDADYVEEFETPITLTTSERAVDVSVETNILEPVSHQYTSTGGGVTRFVLPAKGVLNAPTTALCFEVVNGEQAGDGTDSRLAFQLDAGGIAMLNRITVRCGGQILSRVDEAALYNTIKNKFKSQQFRENVLDVRHASCNAVKTRILPNPAGEAAQAGFDLGEGLVGYHQLMNPDLDQQNTYGEFPMTNGDLTHGKQRNKLLRNFNNAGRGPEVAIRLADIIPFFVKNQLPLFAMAQVEIECEWNKGPAAATQLDDINSMPVIPDNPLAGGIGETTGHNIVFAAPPFLSLDYLHYDENEMMKIQNHIKAGKYAFNFTEVVVTKGINPEYAGAVVAEHVVESNHLLGMMGKEVKKIYVVKNWNLNSTNGNHEKNNQYAGAFTHRNTQLWNLKSANIRDESYNWIINNVRVYNQDIQQGALQHHEMSECETQYQCLPGAYDSLNFNQDVVSVLANTGAAGTVDNTNAASAITQRFLAANAHVIGLNLDKYNEMGNAPGNGTRISSAPIEFRYSVKKNYAGAAPNAGNDVSAIDLTFFIEHRRSLIITELGVKVSDA